MLPYLTVLAIQATRWENLQVEIDSPRLDSSTDSVAIIAVKQLPPVYKYGTIIIQYRILQYANHNYIVYCIALTCTHNTHVCL